VPLCLLAKPQQDNTNTWHLSPAPLPPAHHSLSLPSHADDFESIANQAAAAQLQENAALAEDKQ
jgi:hypothetical protein